MNSPTPSPAVPLPSAAPPLRTAAVLRRLVGRFGPYRLRTAGVLALHLLRSALELSVPWLLGRTLGSLDGLVGTKAPLPDDFRRHAILLAAAMLLRSVAQFAVVVCAASLGQDVENRLRSDLFAQVMRLRFRWHDENRSGKTIARSLRDMEKAKTFFREVAFGYVEIVLVVVGVVILSFVTHWSYGVTLGALFLLAFGATLLVGTKIGTMDRAVSDAYDRVTTSLQENVAGARVVRAFGREPEEIVRFEGRLGAFTTAWKGLTRFWTTILPIINQGAVMAIPLALLMGALRYVDAPGPARLGEALAVLMYMRTARDRIRPLTRLVMSGQEAVASASRVFEVLDRDDLLRGPAEPRRLPAKGGDLRIEGVAFAYPNGRTVLDGIDLHVPAGGSLGLLGRTGAGKTSLVHLIPRVYDPTRGRILLDGIDVRDLSPADLAAAVGLVFQEPFLFSATVAENVAYGRPDVARERIVQCVRLAAADGFVSALPNGYDTRVGERGVSLSGGQRQRLTIARALVMDPRVLVFDDATAAVDAATERELFRGIRAAAEGRTTLVISQRTTSLRWCDRIAVLEAGRVAAIGSHEELLATSALYREVHEHQALERALP